MPDTEMNAKRSCLANKLSKEIEQGRDVRTRKSGMNITGKSPNMPPSTMAQVAIGESE